MNVQRVRWRPLALVIGIVVLLHILASPWTEPFKNHDETRHVMTGVFVYDSLHDFSDSFSDPKGYAQRYYGQYPALGLLVWPPLFYLIEGLAMLVLGPSYLTARIVLTAFVILSAYYNYRLVGDRFGSAVATMATALMLLTPLVFDLSRYCLLEVPTMAFVLASLYHFERYLELRWKWDALFACLFAAFAMLLRFDGIVLLPSFGLRLFMGRHLIRLLDRPVMVGVILALSLCMPYYLLTWLQYRPGLQAAAMSGTSAMSTSFLNWHNAVLYIHYIPQQLGLALTVVSVYGIYRCWKQSVNNVSSFIILIIATYSTFVPLAEPEPRHAIYWVPAWCAFAAIGLNWLWQNQPKWVVGIIASLCLGSTVWDSCAARGSYLFGYSAAATYCQTHKQTHRPWFVDGTLTGGFVLQARLADPTRQTQVLRGDKLLYAVLSDAVARYDEYAVSHHEVLNILHDYDPEFIIVENPSLLDDLPASKRLRQVLIDHPDQFELVCIVPWHTNHYWFVGKQIHIWRKLHRNPKPKSLESIPVLGLGRSLPTSGQ